ncbi:hypothetical protein AS033_11750 [Exiguobacterium indicum]|uniref:Uncharacterized protein n=1 Tax=Exiguobacterium indicum TaxID=296995 RepID=A0A0V8GDG1_9BACL|nr:hypothetical protein [Exiguobacterium enclense]KSU48291.1 hypothetical protein AS033_11750 [Exiguobacterium enclense]SDC98988.1 hypothetical protein SAMN05216342_2397 [Exiguobacterium enclense]
MRITKKFINVTLTGTFLLSVFTGGIAVSADNKNYDNATVEQHSKKTFTQESNQLSEINRLLKQLTIKEKKDFSYLSKTLRLTNEQKLQLLNEKEVLKPSSNFQTQGKIGLSLKALKAAYKSLPKAVQEKFGTQTKFLSVVAAFEHFTGDIEAQIIKDLRAQGFSKTQATIVAKTLTFLAF